MAWVKGHDSNLYIPNNVNEQLLELPDVLTDEEARITLAQFLYANLGLTTKLLLGIKLEKFQEVILRGMFDSNFTMLVLSRGLGKSFIASVYAILRLIFYPSSKIMVASSTFRASRRIFNEVERILNRPEAALAAQCFRQPTRTLKRSDEWIMFLGGCEGTITAIPLSGEKIRGYRSDCLIGDEFATLDEETVRTILLPFLNVPLDIAQRIQIRDREDELIKAGLLEEKDRLVFGNTSQMIALSSASYTFDYLYKTYKLWSDIIDDPTVLNRKELEKDEITKQLKNSKYFICQMSYRAAPEHMIDQAIVQEAKAQDGINSFKREYEAQFVDGGDGYYSMEKMMQATVPDGEMPICRFRGDPNKKYILAVDANFSSAKNADYFAMALLELDKDKNGRDLAYYVHGYQNAGGTVRGHINYFYYLMDNFNIELVIIDSAGADFFLGAIEASELFKDYPKKFSTFDFDSNKEGNEWIEMLDKAKREYNVDLNRIILKHYFTRPWKLRANEYMVGCIESKRLWFAGKASAHHNIFEIMNNTHPPFELMFAKGDVDKADDPDDPDATAKMGIRDAFELQDFIIRDTREQLALIVPQGGGTSGIPDFDLPKGMRKSSSNSKKRRDNYTCLLLACWGTKVYADLKDPNKTKLNTYQSFGGAIAIATR